MDDGDRSNGPPGARAAGDDYVVSWVREGRTDAEIAVRLGTTVALAKVRVAALGRAAGATSRAELAAWDGRASAAPEPATATSPAQDWTLRVIALAMAVASGAAILATALWLGGGRDASPGPRSRVQAPVPIVTAPAPGYLRGVLFDPAQDFPPPLAVIQTFTGLAFVDGTGVLGPPAWWSPDAGD